MLFQCACELLGVKVKQADVILLGWPLDINMTEQIRRNDLDIYSKVSCYDTYETVVDSQVECFATQTNRAVVTLVVRT
jgi:hypothetical protein